ncbi:MAG: hypothetical protein Kow0056_03070 [Coriobacteriia bacterium]
MSERRFVLRADGGSRGNPGPAATGYVLQDPEGRVVAQSGEAIGVATNNVAEYRALISGLKRAQEEGVRSLDVFLDSELVVRQLNGEYRVKNEGLAPLFEEARNLIGGFDDVRIAHVPREENAAADALVNAALDEVSGGTAGTPAVGGTWTLTVKDHFDAAHELHGYPGECAELHGHTWDVEVTVQGESLDEVGIVYDFKRLKDDLRRVLAAFDHAHLNSVPPFDEVNPTAEHLARVVFDRLADTVAEQVRVVEVAVWESPIARITYRR